MADGRRCGGTAGPSWVPGLDRPRGLLLGASSPDALRGDCVRCSGGVWRARVLELGESRASDPEAPESMRWRRDGGGSLPCWLFEVLPALATPFEAIEVLALLPR